MVERSFGGTNGIGSIIGRAMRLAESAHIVRPLAQSPIVYACVRVNADSFAGLPRRVWLGSEDDAEEAGPEDELVQLFDRPNPLGGGRKLQDEMSVCMDLAGGFFLCLVDKQRQPIAPGSMPAEMWCVRDDLVEPVLEGGIPKSWRVQAGEATLDFPDHAIAHIYVRDPHDPFRGLGPWQAAYRSADHLFRAEAFDDGLVEHGGQMSGFLSPEAGVDMGTTARATLAASLKQKQNPHHAGELAVLPFPMKFTPMSFSPADMQAEVFRKMKQEEVAALFKVPPAMRGKLEDANRSSLQEQRRAYYENAVAPRADFIADEMRHQLIPKLPKEHHKKRIQFDYAATPAMREDATAQLDRARKLVGMSVPVAQALTASGVDVDTFEGDEEQFLEGALKPLALAMEPPPPPALPGAAPGKPEAEKPDKAKALSPAIERSTRAQRVAAVEAEEQRLAKADLRVKKAVRRVFDDYILAQIKRLRNLARVEGERATTVVPWNWYTESDRWSASAHEYAARMDMRPAIGSDAWIEVKGISEDELLSLVLGADERWGAALWDSVDAPLLGVIEDAAKAAHRAVGGTLIDANDLRMVEYLRAKEILVKEGPMSVVAEQVKRALIAGLADAPSTGSLADRVRAALESVEDELRALQDRLGTRAAMIARTETAAASNAARVAQWQASGIVQHEWASAGDDLVREGHDIDGEVAIVGEPFSNGMRHPGDSRMGPGMSVNCRCVTVGVVPEPVEAMA